MLFVLGRNVIDHLLAHSFRQALAYREDIFPTTEEPKGILENPRDFTERAPRHVPAKSRVERRDRTLRVVKERQGEAREASSLGDILRQLAT